MNYMSETRTVATCENAPMPISLADQARKVRAFADDVRYTSRRINAFLFGTIGADENKKGEPQCLREDIDYTAEALAEAMDILGCICNMLGV